MNQYRADLHIHTLLSPCGSLEMSPAAILEAAAEKALDIIGIADHNSTRQSTIIRDMAKKYGIFVLCGAEINTKEEIHCLAFMEDDEKLAVFQNYLDEHLIKVPNNPEKMGYQVVVNEAEEIIYEEENLLIAAIDQDIEAAEKFVHSLGGIFIPAHINKAVNSLLGQLGFIPPDLKPDAVEISRHVTREKFLAENPFVKGFNITTASDAHIPGDVGKIASVFEIEKRSFAEIKMALHGENGRRVITK